MIGSEEGRPAAAGCQGCVGSAEWVSHPPIRRLPGGAGRHDRAIRGRAAQSVLRARRGRLRLICELARGPATPPAVTCAVYCVPGSDATSIAESEEVSPRFPDRSADARSAGHVPGPGVLATGKRLVAPAVGAGSSPSAGKPAGRAPGLATDTSAPGYFRMLTARATISATVTMEMTDCRAIASFAQRDSGITSVGLN